MLNRFLSLALPLLLAAGCAPAAVEPRAPASSAATLSVGAVSAADPRASEAGMAVLRRGGTAADAALATMVALTVVEPQSSGIGGGSFLVYHDQAAGRIHSYDGRETAPMAAGPDWFLGPDGRPRPYMEAMPGGKSVGVPGNFRLMALAHERHGRLAWAELFEPAIRLARDGFRITPRLHQVLASTRHVEMTPHVRRTWFGADGQPKPVGTLVRNPELADLLTRVARLGPDHYYTGAPAEALVRTVNTAPRNPSRMTVGDLASYEAKERPPVCGDYRGHRICGMGPPSSGATTVFAILKQLERFDLAAMGPRDPRAWHLFGESMRLAYADRDAYVGDPDFVRVPVAGMVDPAYLASRSRLISPDRAMASVAAGRPPGAPRVTAAPSSEVPATSHLVAVDAAGNVASLTSTIEGIFGSGLTVDGYFLNNELTDFSFAPEENGAPVANRVEGGKRPRSSMSPTIAYAPDGSVRIAVGAAGGPTIIAQVAKVLIGVIDWGLPAQEALALPSFYLRGDRLLVEQGSWLEPMVPELRRLGGNVTAAETGGKLNAVERAGGRWRGAADPRSEGVALAE
jgi:gamma-glutamyltranspeptidase / glutathione hydrolase